MISRSHIKYLFVALWLLSATLVHAQSFGFGVTTISDSLFNRMQGKSYPAGCTVSRNELRLVNVLHIDFEGNTRQGEIICNKAIADDLCEIFHELYRQRYPIERIRPIDYYNADDELSMQANNTSCFCYRVVNGSNKLSAHALGMAIDVNPLYNPYVKRRKDGTLIIQPKTGRPYTNRKRSFKYKITHQDLVYRLFAQHGFTWGGDWRSLKDYQHFEKNL